MGELTEAERIILPGLVATTRIGGHNGTGVAAVLDVDNVAEPRADDLRRLQAQPSKSIDSRRHTGGEQPVVGKVHSQYTRVPHVCVGHDLHPSAKFSTLQCLLTVRVLTETVRMARKYVELRALHNSCILSAVNC